MGMADAVDFAGFSLRHQRIGTRERLTHSRRARRASPGNTRLLLLQKCRAERRVEFTIIVGDFLAFADIAPRDRIAVLEVGIRRIGMIDVMIVIDSEQDFPLHLVTMALDEIAGGLRQAREFLRRIEAIEALDETPDLRLFWNELGGEYPNSVDGTPIEIGFHKQHRA